MMLFFFSSTGARSEEGLPQLFSLLLYSFALWEPDPFHLHVLPSPSEWPASLSGKILTGEFHTGVCMCAVN